MGTAVLGPVAGWPRSPNPLSLLLRCATDVGKVFLDFRQIGEVDAFAPNTGAPAQVASRYLPACETTASPKIETGVASAAIR